MPRVAARVLLVVLAASASLAGGLRAQPRVTGAVRTPDGAPLAGARVELLPILPGYAAGRHRLEGREVEPAAEAAADEGGRFAVPAPRPGTYRLRVSARGRVPMQAGPLALVEDRELAPLVLAEDAGLALRFVTPAELPAPDLWVYVEPSAGAAPHDSTSWRPEFRIGRTGADGRVRIARFAGERLAVCWFPASAPAGSQVAAAPATIVVAAPTGVTSKVRVVDRAGVGLAGVLVRVGPEAWPMGWTDEAGSLALPGAPAEPLALRLTGPGGFSLDLVAQPTGDRPVLVRFPDATPVTGRVLDAESGRPLPGALLWAPADPGTFVRSDADGRFALAPPEAGVFWLEGAAAGYLPKRISMSPADLRGGRGPSLALSRAQSLRGKVVDQGGGPLADAWIGAELEQSADRPPGRGVEATSDGAASDRAGAFELRRLRPATGYLLRAERPGFLPAELRAVVPDRGAPPRSVRVVLRPSPRATGRVEDPRGRPVAGAEVRVAAAPRRGRNQALAPRALAGEAAAYHATTDERGRFTFTQLPASELDLEVEKIGFAAARFSDLKVPATGSEVDLGTLTLRPGAVVRGRIVGPRGQPVPGAGVHEVGDPARPEALARAVAREEPAARSSARGEFALPERPEGVPLHLLILAEGFRPAGVRGVRPPTAEALVVALEEAFTLRGRVLGPDGEPVTEAEVNSTWQDALPEKEGGLPVGPSLAWSERTDRDGRFALAGLPRGEAEISIVAGGYVPLENEPVAVPGPDPAAELTFVLERGALLEGRVATSDGQGVAGAKIAVGSVAALSDDEGFYAFAGVAPGRAEIELVHPHYARVRKRRNLVEGANRLDFELPAGQEVTGRVVDERGTPVAGATVRLRSASRFDFRAYRARSRDDGGFRLAPVADGSYVLGAGARGYPDATRPESVAVAGEAVAGLEVVLARGADLVGKVVGLKPEELWRVEVEAGNGGGESRPAELDLTGHYALRGLALGSWQVRAKLRGGERQARARVELRQAGEVVQRDLVFDERLRLSGLVLFADQPFGGARVSLRAEHLSVERAVTTDHTGRFRFEDLEPDTYRVGVRHRERPVVHNSLVSLAADREILIDLRAVTVAGVVVDAATAAALPGAVVSLEPPPGPETAEFVIASGTDERGAFLLPLVPPGSYRLRGRAEGYVPVEHDLVVPAEQGLAGLEVALEPTAGLEVAIRLATGEVPPIVHYRAVGGAGSAVLAGSLVPDARGVVRLPASGSGSWRLTLDAPGGGAVALTAQAGPVLSVVLPPAAPLAVQVPELGESDLRAQVSVAGPEGTPLVAVGLGGALVESWPMVGGRATIDDLPTGTWIVRCATADGRRWSGVVVASGASGAAVVLE